MTGMFVAVVGPSGAGKDAVISFAAARFESEAGVLFPRRMITRAAGTGEDHIPVSEEEFDELERGGGFALSWGAHGLRYGIPSWVVAEVDAGRTVVVNVSRAVLGSLQERFARVRTVRISVPDQVRRERILSRGREVSASAEARLSRPDPAPGFVYDLDIVNDGPLERAGERLVELIESLHA